MQKEELIHQKDVLKLCAVYRWPVWATDQSAPLGYKSGGKWVQNWGVIKSRAAQGIRPGLPDLLIFVSSVDKKRKIPVFVEMKKPKGVRGGLRGSHILPEQIEFQKLCEESGTPHQVCYGFTEAKDFLLKIHHEL